MEFTELLQKRTSVRSYTGENISGEQITEILGAAVRAPNACNFQSWHFYAVCDREKIKAVHPDIAFIPWINDIPLMIVICTDENIAGALQTKFGSERGRMFAYQDAAGAANHILLKAADMGLGGCWIGPMDTEKCKEHFSIADDHTPVAIITIGLPSSDMPARQRKPLSEAVTVIGGIDCQIPSQSKPFTLSNASLKGAVFENLNLTDASFKNVKLKNAVFDGCDIRGLVINGEEIGK